jgi:hypothetical protein
MKELAGNLGWSFDVRSPPKRTGGRGSPRRIEGLQCSILIGVDGEQKGQSEQLKELGEARADAAQRQSAAGRLEFPVQQDKFAGAHAVHVLDEPKIEHDADPALPVGQAEQVSFDRSAGLLIRKCERGQAHDHNALDHFDVKPAGGAL